MSHDPHFGFVVAAYALAFAIVAGMIVTILAAFYLLGPYAGWWGGGRTRI